ncbi:MAG: hypothetical protein JHC26_10640 [Thermofilum sp.]|jgi:hypothetical protein|uniref:hypothetical protein n=1 Tax=Thermofilum sp. TaxID=1961369 RepID=UPI002586B705|nr:hypothetical protein [Thermofilum sp.]MCI4409538.1 hypothetical protein [Thermofilum sp.]
MGKSDYEKLSEWMETYLETMEDLGVWLANYMQVRRMFPNATPQGTQRLKELAIQPAVERIAQWKASEVMTALAQFPEDARRWHLPSPETAGQQIYDVMMALARIAMDEERIPSVAEAAEAAGYSEKSIYNLVSFARSHGVDI